MIDLVIKIKINDVSGRTEQHRARSIYHQECYVFIKNVFALKIHEALRSSFIHTTARDLGEQQKEVNDVILSDASTYDKKNSCLLFVFHKFCLVGKGNWKIREPHLSVDWRIMSVRQTASGTSEFIVKANKRWESLVANESKDPGKFNNKCLK